MIVITAPTGNIGHQVLSHLLEAGARARVIVRDASKLPEPVHNRVEVVEGSRLHALSCCSRSARVLRARPTRAFDPVK
jgi:uncharacterized protein YbjT (DUF2867 family)